MKPHENDAISIPRACMTGWLFKNNESHFGINSRYNYICSTVHCLICDSGVLNHTRIGTYYYDVRIRPFLFCRFSFTGRIKNKKIFKYIHRRVCVTCERLFSDSTYIRFVYKMFMGFGGRTQNVYKYKRMPNAATENCYTYRRKRAIHWSYISRSGSPLMWSEN